MNLKTAYNRIAGETTSRPAQARVATAITSVILPWKLRHSHTCRHGQRATILVWSQALPFWL